MKKVLGIVLVLAGLLGLYWGYERHSVSAEAQAVADGFLAKSQAATDPTELESLSTDVQLASQRAADAKGSATLGFGGGIVLLAGGLFLLLKGRKRA